MNKFVRISNPEVLILDLEGELGLHPLPSPLKKKRAGGMEGRVTGPAMWKGRAVIVTTSDESSTGFLNVLKQPGNRKKPYYAKFQPAPGEKQRYLPGSNSATAWEAACKLGYYEATLEELPPVIPLTRPRRTSEVSELPASHMHMRSCCALVLIVLRVCRRFNRRSWRSEPRSWPSWLPTQNRETSRTSPSSQSSRSLPGHAVHLWLRQCHSAARCQCSSLQVLSQLSLWLWPLRPGGF